MRTYIQSGNIVFRSDLGAVATKSALEGVLAERFCRPVGVLLRDAGALRALLARTPFPQAIPSRVAVLFLDDAPPPYVAETARGRTDEAIVPGDREVFFHYPAGMGRSRLRLPAMDRGTARNLSTVARLADMASGSA